jgi:TP901 family phage tail tape measure protein
MSVNALGLGMVLTAKNQASPVLKQVGADVGQLKNQVAAAGQSMSDAMTGFFRDKNGRLRDARGKFVKEGEAAGKAASNGFAKALGLGKEGSGLGGLGLAFRAGAVAAVFAAPIVKANEFSDALAALRAISGATAAQMEQLRRASLDAGIATQFSPTEAANALGDLASAGFNVNESMTVLLPTLDLAAASLGQLSPSDAAGLASQALKAFKLSADQAAPTVDKLVNTMNLFAVQARDLPLGLANSVRGASALGQSLDETLISFGLVRNIIPRVESAATAVSIAMERMVDKKVQQAIKGLGVDVTDSAGKFRPFLDVVAEMLPELEKMTEAKRADFLQTTFGAEALGGFNAIMTQVTKGISTSSGETLKGAAAINYLRDQMKNSGGTAAKFRDELLKDLPGQLRLLKGSAETFLTIVGEPMAAALAPLVKGAVDGLNTAISFFDKLSAGAKKNVAQVALAVGTLGVVLALAGGPVTLVLGAIIAGIAGIKYAVDNNIGGLGEKFASWGRSMKLAWEGITQLFSQGGFSGAVRTELNKAENAGIKQFAITVYVWGNRIKNFFVGIAEGFEVGMQRAAPAFKAFGAALERVGVALGLTTENDPSANMNAWARAGAIGAKIGGMLAGAIEWVARAITRVIDFATGFGEAFDFGDSMNAARVVVDELATALRMLVGTTDPSDSASAWKKFGEILGGVATFGANSFASAVRGVARIVSGFAMQLGGMGNIIGGVFEGNWARVWLGMKQVAISQAKIIVAIVGMLVEKMAMGIDAMGKIAGKDFGAQASVKGLLESMNKGMDEAAGIKSGPAGIERRTTRTDFEKASEASNLLHNLARTAELGANVMGLRGTELGQRAAAGINNLDNLAAKLKPSVSATTHVYLDSEPIAARVVTKIDEDKARGGGDIAPTL